jgi:HD-like signal output (HDOD) protein
MFLKDSGFLADTEIGQRNAETVAQVLCLMREREEFRVNGTAGEHTLDAALQAMSTPPPAIVALNDVLGTSPIDLLQLGIVSRSYPAAAAQILKLCNSSIFCLPYPASSLEQAVVSLGAEVLRTLGLAWGLVELAGKYLPPVQAQAFWQHGLTLALLSERIAERMDYPVAEAYLAGFLHDIGRVPMLMAAAAEKPSSDFASESPEIEVRNFGVHHGELGRRIGIAWGFSEPFVEVFSRHHGCDEITEEIELVRIVSAAERFCSRQVAGDEVLSGIHPGRNGQLLDACFPGLEMAESMSLAEVLEFEFLQSAQRLKLGASKHFSPALQG